MDRERFFERLYRNPRAVVLDVWAPWCLPCHAISPVLERLSQRYTGQVDLWKINADQQPDLVRSLHILAIPTLLVYREGREVTRRSGAQSETELEALFEAALIGNPPELRKLLPGERLLRLAAGLSLLILGRLSTSSSLLYVVGGIILFSAVYDRCPIWQSFVPHLKQGITRIRKAITSTQNTSQTHPPR